MTTAAEEWALAMNWLFAALEAEPVQDWGVEYMFEDLPDVAPPGVPGGEG